MDPERPEDYDDVLLAARLGWTFAEFRGRIREIARRAVDEPKRPKGVLPLGQERSQAEQLIEYFQVVAGLADRLALDVAAKELTGLGRTRGTASDALRQAYRALIDVDPADPAATALSERLRLVCYSWDARIQDELASRAAMSAAYQLGRGVAEIRWGYSLEAKTSQDLELTTFFLGQERGDRLNRLITRLAGYYDEITRLALEASLTAWRVVDESSAGAPDDAWRGALREQATIWHDLILGQRDGASLVKPSDVLKRPASLVPIFRKLWLEILAIGVGVALLVGGAALLIAPGVEDQLPAIVSGLGAIGLTFGAISARLRTAAEGLVDALRQDFYRHVVVEQAVVRVAVGAGQA